MHLDSRSLAVFRILLGSLVFASTCGLRPDYSAFFLPETTPHVVWALLTIFLPLFSVLLIAGFYSRVCSIFCWAGIVYVQLANPAIFYGADRLLRLLLFWGVFLPLGESWSVDAWLYKKQAPALPLSNRWAAWAITGQICLVYWHSAFAKTDPLWTQNHNALFFAFSMDDSTSPLGSSLLQYPSLLRCMTEATLYTEFLGPLLLFVPFYRNHFRLAAVILFFIFHLVCMQSLMRLGLFPWVCATAWVIFIPPFFWDRLIGPIKNHSLRALPFGWPLLLDRCMAGLVLVSFMDVLAWNGTCLYDQRVSGSHAETWLNRNDPLMSTLHLNQRWRMYAPFPMKTHGWLIVSAALVDGTQVDLFTRRPVSWSQPEDIGDYLGNIRWRTSLVKMYHEPDPITVRKYCDYMAGRWNADHPENKVKKVTLIFMKLTTQPDLTISGPERVTLHEQEY